MPVLSKQKAVVILHQEDADLSRGRLDAGLSAVDFDEEGKYFYMTMDRAVFTDPVCTIRTVLDAHGFVPNIENILSCLDSFRFSVHTRLKKQPADGEGPAPVGNYLPCLTFELPKKNQIGTLLKGFYDEVSRFSDKTGSKPSSDEAKAREKRTIRKLKDEIDSLKTSNDELQKQVTALTRQLSAEQRSLNRASRALDSQQVLPANARLGRIETIDLKRRLAKVKCRRSVYEIPTHMLGHVPDYQARCLITLDADDETPLGIVFFSQTELADLEHRTAELLFVDGSRFKARDSRRTEFQIKAVNASETKTIAGLRRGDRVMISIADGYVVRFSVLNGDSELHYRNRVMEQYVLHDIARNPLVARAANDDVLDEGRPNAGA